MYKILSAIKYVLKVNSSVNKKSSNFFGNLYFCAPTDGLSVSRQFLGRMLFGIHNKKNAF